MVINKIRARSQIFKAVAYARFSSTNQREESIDAQVRAIKEYCDHNGYELVEIYTDEAVSGKTVHRDNFQRMINDIMSGTVIVDTILVHKFNRFARNKYDSAVYKKKLKDVGIRVISVSQNIEDTPEGEMLESFLESIDEYYSANLSVEIQKGIRENALNGKSNGGRAPFGYTLTKHGTYEINENAPIVEQIFQDYVNGISKKIICDKLTKKGIYNTTGKPFSEKVIKYMLTNEKYIGNFVYHIKNTNETIRLNGIIKPHIISHGLWDKVQELISKPIKKKTRSENSQYLLTGKVICNRCKQHFVGGGGKTLTDGSRRHNYRCRGRTRLKNGCDVPLAQKKWLEQVVFNVICDEILNAEKINEICKIAYNEIVENSKKPSHSISNLKAELKANFEKQSTLAELYLNEKMTIAVLELQTEKLNERRKFLESEIASMTALAANELSLKDIERYFNSFVADLKNETTEADEFKNLIFVAFLDKVYLSHNSVDVKIKINFNSLKERNDKGKKASPNYRLPLIFLQHSIPRYQSFTYVYNITKDGVLI